MKNNLENAENESDYGVSVTNQFANNHPDTVAKISQFQWSISLIGLAIGSCAILIGAYLAYKGVAGHAIWDIKFNGFSSSLNTAVPGIVIVVAGVLIIFVTRFSIKVTAKK